MYRYEDKMKAIDLYIKYNYSVAPVIRELGYPNRHMLVKWYKEYASTGTVHKKARTKKGQYSQEQKDQALEYYMEHGRSITDTIKHLGYPGKATFKLWLNEAYPDRQKYCVSGGRMIDYPQKKKEQAVGDLCARDGTAQEVAERHGVSRITLYEWKQTLFWSTRSKEMSAPPFADTF